MRVPLILLLAVEAAGLEVPPAWARGGALHTSVTAARANRGMGGLIYGESSFSPSEHLTVPLDWTNSSAAGKTLRVRYWVDESCWDKAHSGPIFVHMGGEAAASGVRCGSNEKKFGALALGVEHRFYGESQPSDGLTNANMVFLSVEQNLADTAAIVKHVLAHHRSSSATDVASKVVAWGGSYSGATCAWFRTAHPGARWKVSLHFMRFLLTIRLAPPNLSTAQTDVVDGCVSSSGVVDARREFTAFDTHIHDALHAKSASCAAALRAATDALERAFAKGASEASRVKALFNASNLAGTVHGDTDFFYAVADAPAMLDQYGQKDALCAALAALPAAASDEARIANLAATIRTHYGPDFVGGCFYDTECFRKVPTPGTEEEGVGNRQWRWQKCSEVAYLQSAPSDDARRIRSTALTLDSQLAQCAYAFGNAAVVTPAKSGAFAAKFGGARPDHVGASNIVFLDFSDDPWAEVSVRASLGSSLPFCMTTCDGCGHCGSGVPSNLTHCDDVASANVARWLKQ